jgi:hypothetical protein
LAFQVECECNTPDAIRGIEAQFLHIGESRSLQRVHSRSPQLRAEFREQLGVSQQFISNGSGKFIKLGIKIVME